MPDTKIDIKPPKGMKTVLHNGIPIERSIYDQAVSFANSSNLIYEKDLKKSPRNGQGITPFVVNAAFSSELYLKCLLKTCDKDIQ